MAETEAPAQAGQFRIGVVVSNTFGVFFKNFLPFFLVIAVLEAPIAAGLILFNDKSLEGVFATIANQDAGETLSIFNLGATVFGLALGNGGRFLPIPGVFLNFIETLGPYNGTVFTAVVIFRFFASAAAAGALCCGAYIHLCGGKVTMRKILAQGVRRCLPIAAVILAVFIFSPIWVDGLMFAAIAAPFFAGLSVAETLLATLHLGLVPVLGVSAAVIFCPFAPFAVIRKAGFFGAINQSRRLTKGFRWKVFGVLFIIFFITLAASFLAALPGINSAALPDVGFDGLISSSLAAVYEFLQQTLLTYAFYGFPFICVTAVYHELRAAKGGAGANSLDAVAD